MSVTPLLDQYVYFTRGMIIIGYGFERWILWKIQGIEKSSIMKLNILICLNIYSMDSILAFFLLFPLYLLMCLHFITNWFFLLSKLLISWIRMHTHTYTNTHTVTFSKLSLSHTLMQNHVSHSNSYIYSQTHKLYTYLWAKSQTITSGVSAL